MIFCPKCQSARLSSSHRRRWGWVFFTLLFLLPYRCQSCRHRFYRPRFA
jgi:hypothetical protein